MNLQKQISRIQFMMNISESIYLRRRVSPEKIQNDFETSLEYVSNMFMENKEKWNAMTLPKFINLVITVTIDKFHSILVDTGGEEFPHFDYDEVYNYLLDIYRDEMAEIYESIIHS